MNGNLTILTKEQFYKIAIEKYGDDNKDWVFVCDWCDNKQSFNSFMDLLKTNGYVKSKRYGIITKENLKEKQPRFDQECISEKCNFASYGLFGGSLEVDGHRYLPLADMLITSTRKCNA